MGDIKFREEWVSMIATCQLIIRSQTSLEHGKDRGGKENDRRNQSVSIINPPILKWDIQRTITIVYKTKWANITLLGSVKSTITS